MDSNTSTEFLDLSTFLHKQKWEEDHPIYHYLAQLTAQVRQLGEIFAKKPREISKDEFLLKFREAEVEENEQIVITPSVQRKPIEVPKVGKIITAENKPDYLPKEVIGKRMVETGAEAMKDSKWQKVNEEAKSIWGSRLKKIRDGNAT